MANQTQTQTTTTPATPCKLRDGQWGARYEGPLGDDGDVQITTKGGKTWKAQVIRILSERDGVTICSVGKPISDRPKRSSTAKPGSEWCRRCGGPDATGRGDCGEC